MKEKKEGRKKEKERKKRGHWQIKEADYLGYLMEGMTGKHLEFGVIHKMTKKGGWFLESAF